MLVPLKNFGMFGTGMTGGRILIVDEDDAFRLATRNFLRRQGHDCEAASDAAGAVEMLRGGGFDLLITEFAPWSSDNPGSVEALAEVAATLPVIVLTGHPSVQSAARSVRLQVVAYLVKPCDANELLGITASAMARHRAMSTKRRQLEQWSRELAQMEDALRKAAGQSSAGTADNAWHQTLGAMLSFLPELRSFTDSLIRQPWRRNVLESATLMSGGSKPDI